MYGISLVRVMARLRGFTSSVMSGAPACHRRRRGFVTLAVFGLVAPFAQGQATQPADIRAELERRCQAWKQALLANPIRSDLTGFPEFDRIVELGIPALPYIVEKLEQNRESFAFGLEAAVWRITKKRFQAAEWPEGTLGDAKTAAVLYVRWWREGRKEAPRVFEKLYTEWRGLKQAGRTAEAEDKHKAIVDLGIDILPYLMEKMKAGDEELLGTVNRLTNGALGSAPTRSRAAAWWAENKDKWTLPPVKVDSDVPATHPSKEDRPAKP